MFSALKLFFLSSLLGLTAFVFAELDVSSSKNVAIYWGQNSYNQGSGQYAQQRLGYYCSNTEVDVIQLAFLVSISNPELNFANAGNNCTLFPGSNLFSCPQLEEDITTCQTTYGKTILLSIGGATYSEGGFSSSSAAITAANNLWAIFGPPNTASTNRPFGTSTIDGFDFDFESGVSNMVPFANQLRSLMDANTAQTGKKWFLTAAPQCPYPDAADNSMLNGQVFFDAIWVQFYNNYCGVQSYVAGASTQNNFNFGTWDTWAKTVSKNPAVKVLLGVPGSPTAAGSGYESASALAPVISYSKSFSSFGGVMAWDMSQVYANSGFLDGVHSDLGGAGTPPPPKSSTTKSSTTVAPTSTFKTITTSRAATSTFKTITTSRAATSTFKTITTSRTTATSSAKTTTTAAGSGTVGQWGQCGGTGYTGPTGCVSPYTCVENSVWWSQCQ